MQGGCSSETASHKTGSKYRGGRRALSGTTSMSAVTDIQNEHKVKLTFVKRKVFATLKGRFAVYSVNHSFIWDSEAFKMFQAVG